PRRRDEVRPLPRRPDAPLRPGRPVRPRRHARRRAGGRPGEQHRQEPARRPRTGGGRHPPRGGGPPRPPGPHTGAPARRAPAARPPRGATARDRLALRATAPTNKRFARVLVNRLWARYLGAGLVDPVDDWDNSPKVRDAALLDALARELMAHGYDLKHVARL